MRKASPVHTEYVGDCHQCWLYCYKCISLFGIKGTIFQVIYEAPYAILYHHGLELPENIPNDTLSAWFCAFLPMHTMPDHFNDNVSDITKLQTAYGRCSCGNGYNLEFNNEIQSN